MTYQRQRHLLKCIEGYEERFKSLSIGRWRDRANDLNIKEDGAFTIMRRLRLRYLRKAFDIYQAGVKYKKKLEIQEERCMIYNTLRNERLKAQVLNAWLIFKNRHLTAKDYWYRIFIRLDLSLKRQTVRQWKEVTQLDVEKDLLSHENSIIDTNEDLNHEIGELHQKETDQQTEIKERTSLLTKQGQRILSNMFVRFHSVNLTRGFEKWRQFHQFECDKLRLLEKATQHIKKSQFYVVKSAFKNCIQNSDILQAKD